MLMGVTIRRRHWRCLRNMLGAIAMVGCIFLLLVHKLDHETDKKSEEEVAGQMPTKVDHAGTSTKSDDVRFYTTIKRKVPDGPDPVHNRRAGNSKRPSNHKA